MQNKAPHFTNKKRYVGFAKMLSYFKKMEQAFLKNKEVLFALTNFIFQNRLKKKLPKVCRVIQQTLIN